MKVFSPSWMNRSRKWVLWACGGALTALEEQEPEVGSLGVWRCSHSLGRTEAGSGFSGRVEVLSQPWKNRSRKWVLGACGGAITALEEQGTGSQFSGRVEVLLVGNSPYGVCGPKAARNVNQARGWFLERVRVLVGVRLPP